MPNPGTLRLRTCYAALPLQVLFVVLLSVWPGQAAQLPPGMHSCPSLNACLKLMDGVASAADGAIGPRETELRGILQRFGDPAKHELWLRAAGNAVGWRNLAGAILADGWSWTPSDVPELRLALLKDPGGWLARPLGEIDTPEAIRVLVEDLPRGSENQTDFALAQLGLKAVPFLFPLLEDKETARSAQRVISEMDSTVLPFASRWAQCAADQSQPLRIRLAALRGIAALGDKAKAASASLTGLLSSPDAELRAEVLLTLRATHNPAVIHQDAASCRPQAEQFDSLAFDALLCLREIAAYGEDGKTRDRTFYQSSRRGTEPKRSMGSRPWRRSSTHLLCHRSLRRSLRQIGGLRTLPRAASAGLATRTRCPSYRRSLLPTGSRRFGTRRIAPFRRSCLREAG